jgi:methylenetetrahydrofolate dehydrogenase (NADP+)/methenyltetrahydrofolate cyclohydrolase
VPATLIDGKALAARIRAEVGVQVRALAERGVRVGLDVVLVGDDPASQVYVRNKERACEEAGIRSATHRLPAGTTQEELTALVARLSADDAVDGLLVQLPLPPGLDAGRVVDAIDPARDVDGYHPDNLGRLLAGRPGLVPCTPDGVLRLIDETGVPIEGRRAVVVGRSLSVGRPAALLLLQRNATVTVCHSRTPDLAARVGEAEILVVAVGRAGFIPGAWVRPGAVVIDVGINRNDSGKLVGDVDFAGAVERAAFITPVPGGVGPMTIACLLRNTVEAAARRRGFPSVFP